MPRATRAPSRNPYHRLRQQMLVVLLLFGLAPLCVMAFAGFLANQAEVETRTRNVLEAMVHNRKATIELFLDARVKALELAAAAQPVAALATTAGLDRLRGLLARDAAGGVVELGLLDGAGKLLAYSGPYGKAAPAEDDGWCDEVRVLGRYESDVFLGLGRFPHVRFAVAKHEAGAVYYLLATIDAEVLSELVRQGRVESGADVFIVNRLGQYQTDHGEARALLARADVEPGEPHPGVRIAEVRRRGGREIVATAWLRRDRWLLVAREALPGFPAHVWKHPLVIVVFVLGVAAVPPLSLLVARHRLRQIRGLEGERAALLESVAQSQKMATIGRLAATVAHEINNPLAVIHAQIGVMSDCLSDESTPFARDFSGRLKKIETQVERGRKVTHRLLGFARRVGPDLQPVDVQAALEEAVGFVEKETETLGVRFVRDYQLDLAMIRTSLAQIQQVFLNLINNAVDALGGKGEIVLTIRKVEDGVVVSIADNGPGISDKQMQHLFEPFYSTKSGDHAGLGLAICRETVQSLGGRIDVASRPGEGTTFTLWFPPAPPETGSAPGFSAEAAG